MARKTAHTDKLSSIGVIYLTHDTTNNKYYIGKDVYNNPTYFGSGTIIRRIAKNRPETLTKTILGKSTSYKGLNRLEKLFIDIFRAVKSPMYYNMTIGGDGGPTNRGKTRLSGATQKQIAAWNASIGRKLPPHEKKIRGKRTWQFIDGARKYIDIDASMSPAPRPTWVIVDGKRRWIPGDEYDPTVYTEKRTSSLRGRPATTDKCKYFKFEDLRHNVFEFYTEKEFNQAMNLPAGIAQKLKRYGEVQIPSTYTQYEPGTVFKLLHKQTIIRKIHRKKEPT